MNTSLTAYTPLETLLVFQSLSIYGVGPTSFSRISDLLKKNPHVRAAKQYDGARLTPDALHDLYNRLVKDEVSAARRDASPPTHDGPNGDLQGNPRKRKAPSPPLPSVQEATQNAYLIPKLVEKLYARYRSQLTEEIREEERQIARLQRELEEIEQGKWDERLRGPELPNGQTRSPRGENGSSTNPAPIAPVRQEPKAAPLPPPPAAASSSAPIVVDSQPPKDVVKRPPQPGPEPSTSPAPTLPQPALSPAPPPKTSPVPPSHPTIPVLQPPSRPPPSQNQHPASNLPPTQPAPGQGLGSVISPVGHQSPYPPPQPHPPSQPPNVRSPNPPTSGRQPGSPGRPPLLTPNGPVPHPHVPASSYFPTSSQQLGHHPAAPQGGHPFPHSPTRPQAPFPPAQQHPAPAQGPPGPPMQQPSTPGLQFHPPHPQPVPYHATPGTQPHPAGTPVPPHQGGYMLPPFQVYDTPQGIQQQPSAQPSTPTPGKNRGQRNPRNVKAPPRPASATAFPTPAPPAPAANLAEVLHLLSTPAARPRRSIPSSLSINTTPSSELRWKASLPPYQGSPISSPSVSPIDDVAPTLPMPDPKTAPANASKTRRQGKEGAAAQTEDNASEGSRSTLTSRRQPRRKRGASVTSSAMEGSVRGRTRSQSVTSHADAMSVDNETPRNLKHEASPPAEDVLPGIESTPAAVSAGRRLRGNTLQTALTSKRKREARDTSEVAESVGTPGGPQTIIAPRHFSKMCQPLMNDVTSHKHASLFSLPVKEKDAEGYRDIIRRPQDLKSIKTAINVGAKVVAAAAASADTPGGPNSPGGGRGNVILPLSIDSVPPKAIVNSSQLEKELMRMFANAVMFNSGEEGVVQDTREMFEDVQPAVSNWRSAERTSDGKDRGTESDAVGDEDTAALPKRRKL